MDKYIEAEKQLAELLGYYDIKDGNWSDGALDAATKPDKYREILPRWCRDDAAAFDLMCEHEVDTSYEYDGTILVSVLCVWSKDHWGYSHELVADHCVSNSSAGTIPDKRTAIRYAIVQAVIAKLKAQNKP